MAIIVTGASGLLGGALVAALRGAGERVVTLVRREPRNADEAMWRPAEGVLDPGVLDGASAVVHLAGAPIADKRWNAAYKKELVRSRVDSTRVLVRAIRETERRAGLRAGGGRRRRPRRPGGRRERAEGDRVPAGAVRAVGGGGGRRRGRRGAGGAAADGDRAERAGRRAPPDAARVQGRSGCTAGVRPAVLVVDQRARLGGRGPSHSGDARGVRAGQHGLPGAGHQRRLHPGAGPGAGQADAADAGAEDRADDGDRRVRGGGAAAEPSPAAGEALGQ